MAQDEKPGLRCGEVGRRRRIGGDDGPHATRTVLSTLPSARGLIATSHAARENFIRIMPGVAQAIEEVLRSGHVSRAHGRLFAIYVGRLTVVSARRCFERTSRHFSPAPLACLGRTVGLNPDHGGSRPPTLSRLFGTGEVRRPRPGRGANRNGGLRSYADDLSTRALFGRSTS